MTIASAGLQAFQQAEHVIERSTRTMAAHDPDGSRLVTALTDLPTGRFLGIVGAALIRTERRLDRHLLDVFA